MSKSCKPLFPYHGGKQRIASRIVSYILQIPHLNYAEPFAGGLAVLYAKPYIRPKQEIKMPFCIESINDIDDRVINLYRVARRCPEELVKMLRLTPYSQTEHKEAQRILGDETATEMEKVWAFYYLLMVSFGHCIDRGFGYGKCSQHKPYTFRNYVEAFQKAAERLEYVQIFNEDALHFIQRLDSPDTLFYCDPPYIGTFQGHYPDYTVEQYQALCDLLDQIKGSYILSCSASSFRKHGIEPKDYDFRVEIPTYKTFSVTTSPEASLEYLWVKDRSNNMTDAQKRNALRALEILRNSKDYVVDASDLRSTVIEPLLFDLPFTEPHKEGLSFVKK